MAGVSTGHVSAGGKKVVGGVFGLPEAAIGGSLPPFLGRGDLLLANARSGLALLADALSPCHVWLPSYLCESMIEAVYQESARSRFYEVDDRLSIPSCDWLGDVCPGDLVLLVDYFGFPSDALCSRRVREAGAWLVEDACQALLSGHVGRDSDFVLYSPRKFLGVPDGAILTNRTEKAIRWPELKEVPPDWWAESLQAVVQRREFDLHGGNPRWFDLFQRAEATTPIGPYKMSHLSSALLSSAFDYEAVAKCRTQNYVRLGQLLPDLALFPFLPEKVVPLGFPIRLPQRDRVRQWLFAHEVYPPVHWPVPAAVPAGFQSSRKLAAEIMTLPCDQRYGVDDMERMSNLIRQVIP